MENLHLTEAIQVVFTLNAENVHREIAGLQEAMSTYNIPKGTIIVMENRLEQTLPPGIIVNQAYRWLLDQ